MKVKQDEEKQPIDNTALQAFAEGRTLYLDACIACHGTNGEELKRFAPPSVHSEWVLGDEKKLIFILLHGIEGPVKVGGIHYDAPDTMIISNPQQL